MMKSPFTPAQITPAGMKPTRKGIIIQWEDGTDLSYDFRGLRLACPCASCIDENTGEKLLVPTMVPVDIGVSQIESVGAYALKFPLLRHIGEARAKAVAEMENNS